MGMHGVTRQVCFATMRRSCLEAACGDQDCRRTAKFHRGPVFQPHRMLAVFDVPGGAYREGCVYADERCVERAARDAALILVGGVM
jgi:hypothetical protein